MRRALVAAAAVVLLALAAAAPTEQDLAGAHGLRVDTDATLDTGPQV